MPEIVSRSVKPNITITIQGHEVVLFFSREPNNQVALQVKQALLGTYLAAGKNSSVSPNVKVSADDRDKLQFIKRQAEQGRLDILLVFMFDRLGRKSATGRRTVRARKPPSALKQP